MVAVENALVEHYLTLRKIIRRLQITQLKNKEKEWRVRTGTILDVRLPCCSGGF